MKEYYKILEKEYDRCIKHAKKYSLMQYNAISNYSYNPIEDAKCCAYYHIKDKHFNNKKLINFAKEQL